MRRPLFALFAVVALASSCKDPTPAELVEKTVRALYAGPLGDRDKERDALRVQGSARLQASLAALDAQCSEILANDAPQHGLAGAAVQTFERNCLDGKPLSCGGGSVVGAVEVGPVVGDGASAVVHVGDKLVDVGVKIVDGKFVVDEVTCR